MSYIPENVMIAIRNASNITGVDEGLLQGIAYIESGYNPNVISPTKVRGLFQITGKTWKSIRKQHGATLGYSVDLNEQALTAAWLLKDLSKMYNGNRDLIAIAYNAGPAVANKIRNKNITRQSVANAVQEQRDKGGSAAAGFGGGKENEVFDYPKKLAKAMGESVTLVAGSGSHETHSTKESTKVSDNSLTQPYKYDSSKPFILNLFAATANECSEMSKINQETVNKSKLISSLKAGRG